MCNISCENCDLRIPEMFAEYWDDDSATFNELHCSDYESLLFLTFNGKFCEGWTPQKDNECKIMREYMR